MNFTVVREHREFFRKHHWLECDEVISSEKLKLLNEGISAVLVDRSKEVKSLLHLGNAFDKQSFSIAHDLWRGASVIKKNILNRGLAEIASELIEKKPLRFGYDTLFLAVGQKALSNDYTSFLKRTPTLEEMSCIQGVLCGAMICLSKEEIESNEEVNIEKTPTTIFSKTPGNAVFFSSDWPLPLHEIYQNPDCTYLLVVYVKINAVYFAQQGDPYLYDFKRLGYSFGDRLKEPFHPIVYS